MLSASLVTLSAQIAQTLLIRREHGSIFVPYAGDFGEARCLESAEFLGRVVG
jgi:hypothetical protein